MLRSNAPSKSERKHPTQSLQCIRESPFKIHCCSCIFTLGSRPAQADLIYLLSGVFIHILLLKSAGVSTRPHRLSFAQGLVLNSNSNCRSCTMSNFITNLFPSSQGGKHDGILPVPPPPLHTRSSQNEAFGDRPSTPNRNSFITPVSTPQGSPSKNRNPPGANDLPVAFENAMKITPTTFSSPTKSARGTPLLPGKSNTMVVEDSYFGNSSANIDDSIIHKSAVSPGSPLRKQGKENTPPSSRHGQEPLAQNQAAISRQELYQPREQPTKKYNTQRGLTPEELEILHKPNVKRLANVTQLCRYIHFQMKLDANSSQTSLITTSISLPTSDNDRLGSTTSNPNSLHLLQPMKIPTIRSGRNMLEESVPTCESEESDFARAISRFLHKLGKVDMDRSS